MRHCRRLPDSGACGIGPTGCVSDRQILAYIETFFFGVGNSAQYRPLSSPNVVGPSFGEASGVSLNIALSLDDFDVSSCSVKCAFTR